MGNRQDVGRLVQGAAPDAARWDDASRVCELPVGRTGRRAPPSASNVRAVHQVPDISNGGGSNREESAGNPRRARGGRSGNRGIHNDERGKSILELRRDEHRGELTRGGRWIPGPSRLDQASAGHLWSATPEFESLRIVAGGQAGHGGPRRSLEVFRRRVEHLLRLPSRLIFDRERSSGRDQPGAGL